MEPEHTSTVLAGAKEVEKSAPVAEDETGLTTAETEERFARYRLNETPEGKDNPTKRENESRAQAQ